MVGDIAREFAEREVKAAAAEVDRTGRLPEGLFRRLGEIGLLGLLVPEAYGGSAQGPAAVAAAAEALGAACASTAWAFLAHQGGIAALVAHGSEAAKARYLPALCSGERIAAVAGTEDTGGSNPLSIRTRATADGDSYVLNGSKIFISGAGTADIYVMMARTADLPGPQSLSVFVVEKGTPGLSFGRREETLGVRGVSVGEIQLDACRVLRDQLLGAEGSGLAVLAAAGGCSALGAPAIAVGLAQAAVDKTREHLLDRQILGQPLAAVPSVQQTWAGILTDLETARALYDRAVAKAQAGGPPIVPWLAKAQVTETALRIIDRCLQLHGAGGYTRALPLERMYRDARALSIHWGNNDVLRLNAARLALGQM